MKKKIFTLLLTTVFCFSLVACSGSENSPATTKKEETTTTEKQETEESTSEKETMEPETTTKEETTTVEEKERFDDFLRLSVNPCLGENQDVILEVFNGKNFKKGDTFDCRAEIQNLGYDLEKYALTFAIIYDTICDVVEFECNDFVYDEFYWRPLVDANNNFTGTNMTEDPFHLEISFDIEHDKMNYSIVFD